MNLSGKLREEIEEMDICELLRIWRFAQAGDPIFQGESGEMIGKRIAELRDADPAAYVVASKEIGW